MQISTVISLYKIDTSTQILVPYYPNGIQAGFPSPATDYIEEVVDLNKELIKNPSSTFLGRVTGKSMIDAGIDDGDVLIIDKSLPFRNGSRVLVWVGGKDGFTVKIISIKKDEIYLMPANADFKPILVTAEERLWGVVTYIIKKC